MLLTPCSDRLTQLCGLTTMYGAGRQAHRQLPTVSPMNQARCRFKGTIQRQTVDRVWRRVSRREFEHAVVLFICHIDDPDAVYYNPV